MKLNLKNQLVRQAIWDVHLGICYYSRVPITMDEMELDHVIPKCLKGESLEKTLNQFGLEKDFEISNIKNIVPCTRKENQKKGTDILSNTQNTLNDINRKSKKIEERYNTLLKQKDFNKSMSHLKEETKSDNIKVENIYNDLKNEKPVYEISESYTDDFHHAHYCRSTKRIFLNGFLPRPSSEVSSCLIGFKSLEIRGLMLTMTEKEVFELTDPLHKEKILKNQPDSKHYPDLKDTVLFKHNGVNFFLDIEDINEFYDVLNTYREKIEIHKCLLTQFYGSEKFELSKSKESYRLGKIKRKLWVSMLDFAAEHHCDSGDSEWHMFDAKGSMLLASSGRNCSKYNKEFHAMFIPEQIEQDDFYDFKNVDQEMWILWRKMKPSNGTGGFTPYSIRDRWNAEISYKWMTEDFIPYVVWYDEVSKKDRLLKYGSYKKFKSQFKINQYIWN